MSKTDHAPSLMALLFYSSRAGYDEPARVIEEPEEDESAEAGERDQGKAS